MCTAAPSAQVGTIQYRKICVSAYYGLLHVKCDVQTSEERTQRQKGAPFGPSLTVQSSACTCKITIDQATHRDTGQAYLIQQRLDIFIDVRAQKLDFSPRQQDGFICQLVRTVAAALVTVGGAAFVRPVFVYRGVLRSTTG